MLVREAAVHALVLQASYLLSWGMLSGDEQNVVVGSGATRQCTEGRQAMHGRAGAGSGRDATATPRGALPCCSLARTTENYGRRVSKGSCATKSVLCTPARSCSNVENVTQVDDAG